MMLEGKLPMTSSALRQLSNQGEGGIVYK